MNIEYTVHSVNQGPTRVAATVEGAETTAIIDCIEVELSPVKSRHGSLTLRFTGDERTEAAEMFTPDATLTVTISRPNA